MDNSSQPTEKIIQYLDGELTGTELSDFERLLSEDSALKAELENLQLAKLAVQHYGLKQQVASVHHQMMEELAHEPAASPAAKVYPLLFYVQRIAAALLIGMLTFGAYQFISVSPTNILTNNPSYVLSVERGASESSAIKKAYAANNYKEVIHVFETEANPGAKDYFFGASAYLADHKPAKAIELYKKIISSNNSTVNDYKDDAEYYLAISYLRNRQPKQAKVLLEKIYRDKDHLYHSQVTFFTMLKLKMLLVKSGQ
jgi:tetratricopeptide (TPR) repeat protein